MATGEAGAEGLKKKNAGVTNRTETEAAQEKKFCARRVEIMNCDRLQIDGLLNPVKSGQFRTTRASATGQIRTNPDKSGQRGTSLFPENQAIPLTGASPFSKNRSKPVRSGHGKVVDGGRWSLEKAEISLGGVKVVHGPFGHEFPARVFPDRHPPKKRLKVSQTVSRRRFDDTVGCHTARFDLRRRATSNKRRLVQCDLSAHGPRHRARIARWTKSPLSHRTRNHSG